MRPASTYRARRQVIISAKRHVEMDMLLQGLCPRTVAGLLRLPATALPFPESTANWAVPEQWLELALARLGYPGFASRKKPGPKRNPGEVLLRALACSDFDPRLVEALPWLLPQSAGFAFDALVMPAKLRNLQNRLGFMVSLAREVAEQNPRWQHRAGGLRPLEECLEPPRLAREDGYGSMAGGERMREVDKKLSHPARAVRIGIVPFRPQCGSCKADIGTSGGRVPRILELIIVQDFEPGEATM
jgi:hypothetical protein